jgi:K+-transporting ATPase ATPase C chain
MKKDSVSLVKLFVVMTLITGLCYPLVITAFAYVCYPEKSKGDAVTVNGKTVGVKMIGQKFTDTKYFHARPSAIDYNPMPTGASNLSITSDSLINLYKQRKSEFIKLNKVSKADSIPSEMLFASGSGVDPHISKESAIMQVERIASVRKFGTDKRNELYALIDRLTFRRVLGIELNVQLDNMSK